MPLYHSIQKIVFEKDELVISINGKISRFPLKIISKNLFNASIHERNTYEISPSGYGIHWPLLDEDLSVDGLLGVGHQRHMKNKAA
jgi:hypothetical protein